MDNQETGNGSRYFREGVYENVKMVGEFFDYPGNIAARRFRLREPSDLHARPGT